MAMEYAEAVRTLASEIDAQLSAIAEQYEIGFRETEFILVDRSSFYIDTIYGSPERGCFWRERTNWPKHRYMDRADPEEHRIHMAPLRIQEEFLLNSKEFIANIFDVVRLRSKPVANHILDAGRESLASITPERLAAVIAAGRAGVQSVTPVYCGIPLDGVVEHIKYERNQQR